jgi:hypothetical protein
MELQLTGVKADGTWTWRAPGAKEPKGILTADLLDFPVKVGDVLRAEAQVDLDGVTVLAVLPPKHRSGNSEASGSRLEVIGSNPDFEGGVTTSLVAKRPRRDPSARRDRPSGDRPSGDRLETDRSRARSSRPRGDSRADDDRASANRRSGRAGAERAGAERSTGDRRPTTRDGRSGEAESARPGGPRRAAEHRRPPAPWTPGNDFRVAALAAVPDEHRAIAETVLSGGMVAVRAQLAAPSDGTPVNSEAIIAVAEKLVPVLKLAEWKDRATGLLLAGDRSPLRELRAAITASDVARREDEAKELLAKLRKLLETKLERLRQRWLDEITKAIESGDVLTALKLSATPPDSTARFPAELAVTLSASASEALKAELAPETWVEYMDAVVASPVRRTVKPAGIPSGSVLVRDAVRKAVGRVPALAAMVGLPIPPPPPGRVAPRRPVPSARAGSRPERGSRSAGAGSGPAEPVAEAEDGAAIKVADAGAGVSVADAEAAPAARAEAAPEARAEAAPEAAESAPEAAESAAGE